MVAVNEQLNPKNIPKMKKAAVSIKTTAFTNYQN